MKRIVGTSEVAFIKILNSTTTLPNPKRNCAAARRTRIISFMNILYILGIFDTYAK